jgi:hypothetical protein
MSSEGSIKRRRAFTDLERCNIRLRNDTYPGPQKHLISWFREETDRVLNQGQLSRILSLRFLYLEDETRKPSKLGAKQHYKGDFVYSRTRCTNSSSICRRRVQRLLAIFLRLKLQRFEQGFLNTVVEQRQSLNG